MKLSNKLVLPVLALSLYASSAFAVNNQKIIHQPSLGNLLALSVCNAIAGIASVAALERFISDDFIIKPWVQCYSVVYWINEEVKAIEEYKIKMYQWKAQQIINNICK